MFSMDIDFFAFHRMDVSVDLLLAMTSVSLNYLGALFKYIDRKNFR